MTHYEKVMYRPVIVLARNPKGERLELKFPTKRWAKHSQAYWRLFDAFNPDLPNAQKVAFEEIGPLLVDLVEANAEYEECGQKFLKQDLIEILTGDLSDAPAQSPIYYPNPETGR
jgi:hypothetical protein